MTKIQTILMALAIATSTNAFAPRAFSGQRSALASSYNYPQSQPTQYMPTSEGIFRGRPTVQREREISVWNTDAAARVQGGGTLRTWSLGSYVEKTQVLMRTEGRPLNANIDLWNGPDNVPLRVAVYCEDGALRPFNAVFPARGGNNAVAIRNTAQIEFPLTAVVLADEGPGSEGYMGAMTEKFDPYTAPVRIQGGSLKTFAFASQVASIQLLLKTEGRSLSARIELLQGPNNNKQVVEVYTDDGMDRPFYMLLETPGPGNVLRLINTSPIEFPIAAQVEAYETFAYASEPAVVSGGGFDRPFQF